MGRIPVLAIVVTAATLGACAFEPVAGYSASTREADRVTLACHGGCVRHWTSYHGIAINLDPELEHFSGIVPCGIAAAPFGVTSLHDLGKTIAMAELDSALRSEFAAVFGRSPST